MSVTEPGGRPPFIMPTEREALRDELAEMGVWIVIPMFRVKNQIADVLAAIPDWVEGVVAVDDKCPEGSGAFATTCSNRPNFHVIEHAQNQGVGGAVMTGYRKCCELGARIIVKVDGDNQMDLRWLGPLVLPIASGVADYTKGNRFSSLSHVKGMPFIRLFGNSALSLMSKVSSGYWNVFDPTNGYTAIHAEVARELATRNVAKRYFFESDVLYHLGAMRAVVRDVAMPAIYADEESNLSVRRVVLPFLFYHTRNAFKRFVGHYIIRNFTVATLETIFGMVLIVFGAMVAFRHFVTRADAFDIASPGLVMLSALPVMLGVQLLLAALNFDILNVPRDPIYPQLKLMRAYRSVAPTT
ncbi:glycosyltransferase family 2 protein [Hyphomonas sp. CACIAM 19H1]|uniref:glycosyltransferase family 2 protein n=1 Tax=Hyphomonas sp. CACIAM 19H1 TaxID=1873716 RepID=UPI001F192D3D|nr:glycosyltransferase family 2 protein [Hyphomonas sp. CACIAM 19H1]